MIFICYVIEISVVSICFFFSIISLRENINGGMFCWKIKKNVGVIIVENLYKRNRGFVVGRNCFFRIFK